MVYKALMNGVDEVAVKLVKADKPTNKELTLFHKEAGPPSPPFCVCLHVMCTLCSPSLSTLNQAVLVVTHKQQAGDVL